MIEMLLIITRSEPPRQELRTFLSISRASFSGSTQALVTIAEDAAALSSWFCRRHRSRADRPQGGG